MFGSPTSAGRTAGRRADAANPDPSALFATPDMDDNTLALAQARRMLNFIDVARSVFPGLREFADHPGLEIMLHIFVAGPQDGLRTIADLCALTGCWQPLTQRYVELLIARDVIEHATGPGDADAQDLRLTASAAEQFTALLASYARGRLPQPDA